MDNLSVGMQGEDGERRRGRGSQIKSGFPVYTFLLPEKSLVNLNKSRLFM